MKEIEISDSFDKGEIFLFLLNTKYRKFNLWPNINEKNIAKFLNKEIENIRKRGVVFAVSHDNEIIALVTLRKLNWDTQFYKFKCSKIDYILTNKKFSYILISKALNILMERVQKYSIEKKIKLISTSIDSWESAQNYGLQRFNFKYILTWIDGVYFASEFNQEAERNGEVGSIKEEDIDYFKKISSENYFKGGRFYLDNNFDKHMVGKMYEKLIESSYENNEIMLVYRLKKQPAGLFICKKIITYQSFSNIRIAPLRYLIVDPKYRKKSIARNLFIETLRYLSKKSDLITTGLEVNNIPSLNLHSKLGFKFNFTHNVYHYWNNF